MQVIGQTVGMTQEIVAERFQFEARDGYILSGLSVVPEAPKAAVLISSGTGFPKELYRRMAKRGAEQGYACFLYDYRGIAGSAPETLKGFRADMMDWARRDFPAALDEAESLAPGKPLFTLGHSVGGHLLGFADNALKPKAHAFVCTGTGYWGAHHASYKPLAAFFWLVFGPLSLASKGYIPGGSLWPGEPLPREVFLQWRQWASKPGYFSDYFDRLGLHYFDTITAPIRNYTFSDDTNCSPRSSADLMDIYTAAPKEILCLTPEEMGAKSVDHFGAFKRQASAFWPMPFDWFDEIGGL